MPDSIKTTYGGITITIKANGTFNYELDGEEFWKYTLEEARNAIDRHQTARKRSKRASVKLKAFDKRLRDVTITGIHGDNGNILTSPRLERFGPQPLYADVRDARKLATEIQSLQDQIDAKEEALKKFRIELLGTMYGVEMDDETHAKRLQKLKDNYAKALNGESK